MRTCAAWRGRLSRRASSKEAIELLHREGIRIVMLTGDSRATAAAVARALGIDEVIAEVLPADNPRKSIWRAEASVARTEKEGQLMSTMMAPQVWRFVNPAVKGVAGDPVAASP